jgi:hypothetical protein
MYIVKRQLSASVSAPPSNKPSEAPVLGTPQACAKVGLVRERILPLVDALVVRARDAGELRADFTPEDMPVLQWMLGNVLDYGRELSPELWRRFFHLMLRGLRADPQPPEPLPVPALDRDELERILASGQLHAR